MSRRLALSIAVACAGVAVCLSSCGAFELGDVVPLDDDAATSDALVDRPDAPLDACVPDGADPCGCLAPAVTVVPGPHGVGEALAVANGQVFFLLSSVGGGGSDRAVYRAPVDGLDGGAPVRVMVPAPVSAPLVAGGSQLFLRRIGTGLSVMRVPQAGVDQTPVVHAGPLPLTPNDLAANADDVYWPNGSGAVCVAAVNGAPRAPDMGDSGCVTQPFVPPRDGGAGANAIVLSATDAFWSGGTKLWRAPLADGTASSAIVTQTGGSVAVVGGTAAHVYWVFLGADAGALWSAQDDGGAQTKLVASLVPERVVPSVAVDVDGVFWGETNFDRILAADRDGSNVRALACNQGGVAAIATDATFVYWVTTNGAVLRIAKRP